MKRIILILSVLALIAGCGQTIKKVKVTKPTVTVTILPQKYFVEQIAGDFCNVNVMMPPGAGEHEYEPTPKQVKSLVKSDIYFFVGHLGFEKSWMKKLAESAPKVNFVSCSKQVDLLNAIQEQGHHHNDETLRDGTDPHIWTSPENVKTISKTICDELSAKYPEMKPTFEANRVKFVEQLNELDIQIRNELSDSTMGHAFMIFHPALGYYARDYHLEQYTIEFEGKTPSTAHMKNMIDLARKENISTIFLQAQFETAKAEAIAKEINADVVTIDPLAENWMAEMLSLTEKMKIALTSKTVASIE